MSKKTAKAKFSITLDEFYKVMSQKISFVKRDMNEFAKYNISENDIEKTSDILEAFAELPTDIELLGLQTMATETKGIAAEALRQSIKEIMDRAEMAYGKSSAKYNRFGVKELSRLDGGSLSTTARRISRIVSEYFDELQVHGLTDIMTQQVIENRKSFDLSMENQEDAIAARDIAAEERLEKANTIYEQVSGYCNLGRKIWGDSNEARYNDYIIYDTPSGSPEVTVSDSKNTTL